MKVALQNLTKQFGSVVAVNDLSLEIESGEFIALLGPSGCGKTTALLMLAGIYKPLKGSIYFGDRVVNELPPKERDIGMVFQSYALYPHMSIFDNIAFPLTLQKVPKGQVKERVNRVACMMRLEQLLERRPNQLSGGQQQRVALARALVREPSLLLMDEPLSNLDAQLRLVMRAEIKRLQKELGITTIFVTHDQVEAMTMADRVAVLCSGHLRQFSSPDELYYRPRDLFVAGFIATPPMNFLPVCLEQTEGRYVLRGKGFQLEIPTAVGARAVRSASGSNMILGLRPEDIVISRTGEGIPAEVYVTEPLGRELLVNLQLDGQGVRVLTSTDFKVTMGERVWLRFDTDKVYLFDCTSEKSLLAD